jgi:DNA-binding transcriptional LysR family regulator
MTLRQLAYYCAVCECGSVTKAAEREYVTQPAVTAALRGLEREYQVCLVNKDGRKIRLTKSGKVFYKEAQKVLASMEYFDTQMRRMVSFRRHLNIGITKSAGSVVYMEYMADEKKQYRDFQINLTVKSSSELLKKLRAGELDAAVMPDHGIDPMKDMEKAVLKETEMLFCVSKSHPLASQQTVSVSMIENEDFVSSVHDDYKIQQLQRLFEEYGHGGMPRVSQRFEQLDIALRMVESNLAAGYFPEGSILYHPGITGLRIREALPVPVCAVWKNESWVLEGVRRFIKGICHYYDHRKKRTAAPAK